MQTSRHLHAWQQCGITLIEQVMAISITALLITLATPGLHRTLKANEVGAAQNEIIAALQYTRSAAITSGIRTVFCPSTDQSHCASTTQWERGWLIGTDANHDNQPDGRPKYTGIGHGRQLHIRSSAGRKIVRYQADGSASGSNLTLVICQEGGSNAALSVVVSNSGRVRGEPASAAQTADCAAAP